MGGPAWLTARPIAHRGLHGATTGAVENSASAVQAALACGYAIECDVQVTADGDAVVFHDDTLDRLTAGCGAVREMPAEALAALALAGSTDTILRFSELLGLVAGCGPVICEIKSRFDGDLRLAERVAELAAGYPGPLALKSFDPAVLVHLRALGCPRPLGIVTEAAFDDPEWTHLPATTRHALANLLHFAETRPDFLSFDVTDMPHAVPLLFRAGIGRPVLAWTVRDDAQRRCAERWADAIVFEALLP